MQELVVVQIYYLLHEEKYLQKISVIMQLKLLSAFSFYPFFWCLTPSSSGCFGQGFTLGPPLGCHGEHQHQGSFTGRNTMSMLVVSSSSHLVIFIYLLTRLCTSFFFHGSSALCHVLISCIWWLLGKLMRAKEQFLLPRKPALSCSSCAFL